MPGEFYIEGKKEKVDLTEIKNLISQIQTSVTQVQNNITTVVTKSEGLTPVIGSATGDWETAESDVVAIGSHNARYKVHSLVISISNLVGTAITVRLYMLVNGVECKVYEQAFDATADPQGLWVINGTVGIHEGLRATMQSNDAADNGQSVDFDYMLEVM